MRPDLRDACCDLLYREARLLDERRWDDWLDLYLPDAEYWIPAWHDDAPTTNPRAEVSLVYYPSREGLEDRVWRITSGLSAASTPLPRTCHLVSNIHLGDVGGVRAQVHASFLVHVYTPARTNTFFGRYEYELIEGDALKIKKKKVILVNDVIPSVLDVYCV